jgi:hypothetical protein
MTLAVPAGSVGQCSVRPVVGGQVAALSSHQRPAACGTERRSPGTPFPRAGTSKFTLFQVVAAGIAGNRRDEDSAEDLTP